MKYIKKFEKSDLKLEIKHKEKLNKIDFKALSEKYKNHFFLSNAYMREYDYQKKDFYIVLVENIQPHNSPYPLDHIYTPYGDSFTIDKKGKISDPAGWVMSTTEKGFNNIHFMSANEFYEEHTELCIKLFEFVIKELNKNNCGEWYRKQLKWFQDVLETIPDLQYIKNSIKYNL